MKGQPSTDTCCTPVDPPADPERSLDAGFADAEFAVFAKAAGHPVRVRILRMLAQREARACSIIVDELPLAQSTVSEHLRILKNAGLIRANEQGLQMPHLDVFDPPMWCSSGVCGPSVDPLLAAFAADVDWLVSRGVTVRRYNLSQDPQAVVVHPLVSGVLQREGDACLARGGATHAAA